MQWLAFERLRCAGVAGAALDQYMHLTRGQTVETIRNQFSFKQPENMERYMEGLRNAELPYS